MKLEPIRSAYIVVVVVLYLPGLGSIYTDRVSFDLYRRSTLNLMLFLLNVNRYGSFTMRENELESENFSLMFFPPKGLFTRTDVVPFTVRVPVKVYYCIYRHVIGTGPFPPWPPYLKGIFPVREKSGNLAFFLL